MLNDIQFKLPICAVCNKSVERLTTTYDRLNYRTLIWVHCHGWMQFVGITDKDLMEVKEVTFGKAFLQGTGLQVRTWGSHHKELLSAS